MAVCRGAAGEVSLEHYAELLAYMLHDRDVALSDALSIHGISEALWHRADAHWSEELSGTTSWYRVRLAMEFGAAFMRTRIALRNLDGIEPKTLARRRLTHQPPRGRWRARLMMIRMAARRCPRSIDPSSGAPSSGRLNSCK